MKYVHLVLSNLFRKRTRTALTTGSFAVALFLFGILAVVDGAFQQGVDVAGVDRLVVLNRVSIIQPLLVTTVIWALPLGHFLTHQTVGAVVISSARGKSREVEPVPRLVPTG